MPARPRPAALEAEGPTESRTAGRSRQALNRRRTEIRTIAHCRLESRRVERSERQPDRTTKAVQFPRRERPLWNFFRHGVRRAQLLHTGARAGAVRPALLHTHGVEGLSPSAPTISYRFLSTAVARAVR